MLVLLAALSAASSCRRRQVSFPRSVVRAHGESPLVRVRLATGKSRIRLGAAETGVMIADAGNSGSIARIPPGVEWDAVLFGPGSELRVAMPDGRVSEHHPDGIRIAAQGSTQRVKVDGTLYRGEIVVRPDPLSQGKLTVINILPLEEYLRSVITAEMGALDSRFIEALKAQAVASRSFAMAMIARNASFSFDLTADTEAQVYRGASSENPTGDTAVRKTWGECLIHKGRVITAFYHSSCGGRTAAPEEVWGGQYAQENTYLSSVNDGDHDSASKWASWEVKWTRDQLLEQIKNALPPVTGLRPANIGEPSDIEVVETGPSGRNVLFKVTTDKRILQVKGDAIRRVLRTPEGGLLPSTFFTLSVVREKRGAVVIVARGRGNGHGLGMCQTGAISRARGGESYTSILKRYYKGVRLTRLY